MAKNDPEIVISADTKGAVTEINKITKANKEAQKSAKELTDAIKKGFQDSARQSKVVSDATTRAAHSFREVQEEAKKAYQAQKGQVMSGAMKGLAVAGGGAAIFKGLIDSISEIRRASMNFSRSMSGVIFKMGNITQGGVSNAYASVSKAAAGKGDDPAKVAAEQKALMGSTIGMSDDIRNRIDKAAYGMEKTAGVEGDEGIKMIAQAYRQFGKQGETPESIANKLDTLKDKTGIDLSDKAKSISYLSDQAEAAGVSFNDLIASIATLQKQTGDYSKTEQGISTLLGKLEQGVELGEGEKKTKINSLGGLIDYYKANPNERGNIMEAFGGKKGGHAVMQLLDNANEAGAMSKELSGSSTTQLQSTGKETSRLATDPLYRMQTAEDAKKGTSEHLDRTALSGESELAQNFNKDISDFGYAKLAMKKRLGAGLFNMGGDTFNLGNIATFGGMLYSRAKDKVTGALGIGGKKGGFEQDVQSGKQMVQDNLMASGATKEQAALATDDYSGLNQIALENDKKNKMGKVYKDIINSGGGDQPGQQAASADNSQGIVDSNGQLIQRNELLAERMQQLAESNARLEAAISSRAAPGAIGQQMQLSRASVGSK